MDKREQTGKKEYHILFLTGCILGAACFLFVYGYRILNPLYDDWLFTGDMDLKQHYIGFCHFRQSRWQFPIGLIETLSYPNSMSVIYTDSIPLFAVFFKIFSYILPVRFQYFGLFGILSFMLMGGFSALLLRRFTDNRFVCAAGSVFFILAYPVIQRLYYHTALSAQWIIILCLCIWLYQEEMTKRKRLLLWSLMGFLCVGIHSYFLPMAGLIMLCAVTDEIISSGSSGKASSGETSSGEGSYKGASLDKTRSGRFIRFMKKPSVRQGILTVVLFCASALLNLYILGGFYGGTDASGPGLGTFNSNLNTFINPLSDGKVYGSLPLYNGFQYEGFGYLGFGIICLLAIAAVLYLTVRYIKPAPGTGRGFRDSRKAGSAGTMPEDAGSAGTVPEDAGSHGRPGVFTHGYRIYISAALFLVSAAMAILPMVTLNDKKLFGVPYPGFIHRILSIFRSNGRFIWPCVYLLMLAAIVIPVKILKNTKKAAAILLIAALVLQLYDISYMLSYKHEQFAKEQRYENVWTENTYIPDIRRFSGFVFLYNDNDIIMDTAFYAYLNGMWQNNYYYARDINEIIDNDINEWKHELKNGMIQDNVIYIFKDEDPNEELTGGLLTFSDIEGHVYGWKK
ncbi:MAG: DUF6311 domain-containing protein [Lachnospiraceae bacterium]|nr:DUF6311 domain-containing protein [Lachnospiraceae bacterium]